MTDTMTLVVQRANGPKRRSPVRSTLVALKGLVPIVVGLGLWQLLGTDASISFPRPSSWFPALGALEAAGVLWPAAMQSLATFFGALVAATVLGTLLGVAIGWSRRVERALDPLLEIFRAVPPPAYVPLAGLLIGISLSAAIATVTFAVIWPILLNVVAGVRAIPQGRVDMARSLRMRRGEFARKILGPSIAPATVLGIRVAVSVALIVTLLIEIIGSATGIGTLLLQRQSAYDSAAVWGLLLLVGVFGYIANLVVNAIEVRVRTRFHVNASR